MVRNEMWFPDFWTEVGHLALFCTLDLSFIARHTRQVLPTSFTGALQVTSRLIRQGRLRTRQKLSSVYS